VTDPPRGNDSGLDWDALREFARRRLRSKLRFTRDEDLEDLAQECVVGLLRFSRREAIHTPEAAMSVIVDRTAIDWIRSPRGRGAELPLEDGDGKTIDIPAPEHPDRSALERLRFTVAEFFRETSAPCLEIALHYFVDPNLKRIAERLGLRHDVVRQRWTRCRQALKKEEAREPGFLGDYLECLG
jgi:RNA polymerase sigma factor (sigma-70 family)